MSLYQEFSALLPYLQSVRKLKNYLSFDVSFPTTWKLPKKFVEEDKIMEQQSPIANERLFSYVTEIDEEKKLFEKQNLDKLKGLYFDISEPTSKKLELEDDEEQITTTTT